MAGILKNTSGTDRLPEAQWWLLTSALGQGYEKVWKADQVEILAAYIHFTHMLDTD